MLIVNLERIDKDMVIIPEESVRTHAYLLWEKQGKPEGKEKEHYEEACRFFRNYAIVSDGEYQRLTDLKRRKSK